MPLNQRGERTDPHVFDNWKEKSRLADSPGANPSRKLVLDGLGSFLQDVPEIDLLGRDVHGSAQRVFVVVKPGFTQLHPGGLQGAVHVVAVVGLCGPGPAAPRPFSVGQRISQCTD